MLKLSQCHSVLDPSPGNGATSMHLRQIFPPTLELPPRHAESVSLVILALVKLTISINFHNGWKVQSLCHFKVLRILKRKNFIRFFLSYWEFSFKGDCGSWVSKSLSVSWFMFAVVPLPAATMRCHPCQRPSKLSCLILDLNLRAVS